MTKLQQSQKRFAVRSIRHMMGRKKYRDGPQRLRNFIRINYGVLYTMGHCRKIWEQYSTVRGQMQRQKEGSL
jgi:hypothetical protein